MRLSARSIAARDRVGGLDHGRLDVDDAEAEADLRPQLAEHGEFFRRSMRGFHHDMIDVKRVEIVDQLSHSPFWIVWPP